jgi:LPXTG-site transpeptidase (sortase) family protein
MLKKLKNSLKILKRKTKRLISKPRTLKILRFSVLVLLIYLILAPFLPEISYQLRNLFGIKYKEEIVFLKDKEKNFDPREPRFQNEEITGNRLIIPSIGVHIAISEGVDESALSKGAWRRPNGSTPERGGNTVITGHRFQYLPPNNKTFYNLNKLEKGAKVFVFWNDKQYTYSVYESFIATPQQHEVEAPTSGNILTLYTCHPLWTADKRLVVRASLVD